MSGSSIDRRSVGNSDVSPFPVAKVLRDLVAGNKPFFVLCSLSYHVVPVDLEIGSPVGRLRLLRRDRRRVVGGRGWREGSPFDLVWTIEIRS